VDVDEPSDFRGKVVSHTGPRLTRRRMLGLIGGVGVAVGVGFSGPALSRQVQTGKLLPSDLRLPAPFLVPLPVPPVLTPTRDDTYGGADVYEIVQRSASQELVIGVPTPIWGYNGVFPGPTIVSRAGTRTVVRHRNLLPVPTVTHLHGGHTPADSDGYPTDLLHPEGGTHAHMSSMPGMAAMGKPDPLAKTTVGVRDYDYPLTQRASTLWYHDHRMGFTGPGVWHGLAGFHLVHDAEEDALPLPRGNRDVPLMIADRSFSADGSLRYPAVDPTFSMTPGVTDPYMGGVFGDVILVNGAAWPLLEVAACRYRFRILNASNARRYGLALSPPPPDGAGLVQIGSDGGLLDHPVAHDQIDIAPAERFDVIVDFSRYRVGQEITMINTLDHGTAGYVMRFRVDRRETDDTTIPDQLTTLDPIDTSRAVGTRSFLFQNHDRRSWVVNGNEFDPTLPVASPRLGEAEIWRLTADFHHSVHIHLAQFRVLSRNDNEPGAYDRGWKDTLDLRPAEEAAVMIRFTDYPGRYVMHCHNLEHEDMAMMATIDIT
jgi:spore coat protein A